MTRGVHPLLGEMEVGEERGGRVRPDVPRHRRGESTRLVPVGRPRHREDGGGIARPRPLYAKPLGIGGGRMIRHRQRGDGGIAMIRRLGGGGIRRPRRGDGRWGHVGWREKRAKMRN